MCRLLLIHKMVVPSQCIRAYWWCHNMSNDLMSQSYLMSIVCSLCCHDTIFDVTNNNKMLMATDGRSLHCGRWQIPLFIQLNYTEIFLRGLNAMVMLPTVTQLNHTGIHLRGHGAMLMPPTVTQRNYTGIHLRGHNAMVMPHTVTQLNYTGITLCILNTMSVARLNKLNIIICRYIANNKLNCWWVMTLISLLIIEKSFTKY